MRLAKQLFVVAVFSFCCLSTHAIPRLIVGTVRGFPDATVEIPLRLSYASNDLRNVVALQADVIFDAVVLTPGSPTGGDALAGHELAGSSPLPNTQRLLVYSLEGELVTNGVVANLPVSVASGIFRNLRLTLTNAILSTAAGESVAVSNVSGAVIINPVYVRPDGAAEGYLTVATNIGTNCYVVQATMDFKSWASVATNAATGDFVVFFDAGAAGHSYRFYRAVGCDGTGSYSWALASLRRSVDGRLEIAFSSAADRSYEVEASTNLQTWISLQTLAGTGGLLKYIDPSATNYPYRYYRIRGR